MFSERVLIPLRERPVPRLPLSEQERDQVRGRILAAARELVERLGADRLSMRAIGARVGLTASALYAYFPAKQDLLRALWQGAIDDLDARFRALSAAEPDPLAALAALARAYAGFALEDPVRFRLLFFTPAPPGAIDDEDGQPPQSRIGYAIARERVVEAIDRGLLRLGDAPTDFPFQSPWRLVETMIATVLRGLSRAPLPGESR
jgi:AcrR family transcriptional regulator